MTRTLRTRVLWGFPGLGAKGQSAGVAAGNSAAPRHSQRLGGRRVRGNLLRRGGSLWSSPCGLPAPGAGGGGAKGLLWPLLSGARLCARPPGFPPTVDLMHRGIVLVEAF